MTHLRPVHPFRIMGTMRLVSLVMLTALLILAPGGAAGQSLFPKAPVKQDYPPPPPPVEQKEVPYKSPVAAVMISVGGTLGLCGLGGGIIEAGGGPIGGLLSLVGLLWGPSLGHVYTGHINRMWTFTLLRTGSLGLTVAGMIWMLSPSSSAYGPSSASDGAVVMTVAGLYGLIGLTLVEFVWVGFSANDFNEEARQRKVSLAPMVFPNPTGDNTPNWGLSFAWSF